MSTYVNGLPGCLNGLKIAVSGLMDIGREKMEDILMQYGAKVSRFSMSIVLNMLQSIIIELFLYVRWLQVYQAKPTL